MTIETAKRIAKGITDKIECNTADIDDWAEFWQFSREEYEEFLDMPIKTLEQEQKSEWEHDHEILKAYADGGNNALEKIKADIEGLTYYCCEVHPRNVIDDILEILDKYKAESKDEE
jgi:YHS domain-containing protein